MLLLQVAAYVLSIMSAAKPLGWLVFEVYMLMKACVPVFVGVCLF